MQHRSATRLIAHSCEKSTLKRVFSTRYAIHAHAVYCCRYTQTIQLKKFKAGNGAKQLHKPCNWQAQGAKTQQATMVSSKYYFTLTQCKGNELHSAGQDSPLCYTPKLHALKTSGVRTYYTSCLYVLDQQRVAVGNIGSLLEETASDKRSLLIIILARSTAETSIAETTREQFASRQFKAIRPCCLQAWPQHGCHFAHLSCQQTCSCQWRTSKQQSRCGCRPAHSVTKKKSNAE